MNNPDVEIIWDDDGNILGREITIGGDCFEYSNHLQYVGSPAPKCSTLKRLPKLTPEIMVLVDINYQLKRIADALEGRN